MCMATFFLTNSQGLAFKSKFYLSLLFIEHLWFYGYELDTLLWKDKRDRKIYR